MTIIPENLIIHEANKLLKSRMDKYEIHEKVLFKKKTDFHSIYIVKNDVGKFIKYKDTYQAGMIKNRLYTGNIPYVNYFLIPFLMNKNIKDILFVGFGSGIIINQYEKIFNSLRRIDIVDIEEYIFPIAQKYFDFKISDKMNFYLQDALIYLKTAKKKYDLIVVDVAGDEGIDERFCENEYLNLVNERLKKNGIFVSNLPSSRDIFNKKNKFIINLLENYKNFFSNIDIYNGETSNKIYYKTFFNIDESILDITNLILISSNHRYKIQNNNILKQVLNVDIDNFIQDKVDF